MAHSDPRLPRTLKPIGDRVIVKPAPKEETTKSGIVIPDTAKEKPQEGIVVAVGPGRITRATIDDETDDDVQGDFPAARALGE